MKLSPNLRKQTKEVRTSLITNDAKRAQLYEVKKLESLLAMVREPDEKSFEEVQTEIEQEKPPSSEE